MHTPISAWLVASAIGLTVGLIGLGLVISNTISQTSRCDQLAQNYRAINDKPVGGLIAIAQARATYEHACGTPESAAAADANIKQIQDDAARAAAAAAQQASQAAVQQQAAAQAAAQRAAQQQADAQAATQRAAQQAAEQAAQKQAQAKADAEAAQAKADAEQAKAQALGPDGSPYGMPADRSHCEELLFEVHLAGSEPRQSAMQADYVQAGCPGMSGFQASVSA
jgi:hypothetical protein